MSALHRSRFRRDAKTTLVQLFVQAPAVLLLIAWVIWWAASLIGLPGNELATGFLGDAFQLLVFIQTYVIMLMLVPAILCMLSDPVGTRLAMWALGSCLLSLMPQVFFLMQTLGDRAAGQPVVATQLGVRFAIRPQPPIPAFGFSPGASPQLE